MEGNVQIGLKAVARHFENLEDPRSTINLRHPLTSIVVIALMAVLAGADGPTAIAKWARSKEALLREHLNLPNGVPRKDVFRRVLSSLNPAAFQAGFASWLQELQTRIAQATGIERPILAVDGKTLRRSHDRGKGLGALHSVSVWASDFGLTLAQVACEQKSNEITAIPEVLKLVNLQGAIVTIDAMGTQTEIAQQIVDGEGDYVLALKGNQGTLHQGVIDYMDEQFENDFADGTARQLDTEEKGHGRVETRSYIQMPAPTTLPGYDRWTKMKSIGMVLHSRLCNGEETTEVRYYISSLEVDVKQFAHAARGHWGIENTCHWCLDVTYREDESRTRNTNARENLAWLRRFTLSLLKQHPSKDSIAMKRRTCGWDDDFLIQVLTGQGT